MTASPSATDRRAAPDYASRTVIRHTPENSHDASLENGHNASLENGHSTPLWNSHGIVTDSVVER